MDRNKGPMVLLVFVIGILVVLGILWIIGANVLSSETEKVVQPAGALVGYLFG